MLSKVAVAMSSFLFLSTAAFSGDDEWVPVNPFSGDESVISEGRTLFNVLCSHCHGPNAIQGERPRDLRRLSRRYKDRMTLAFLTTVLNGRPEKGMPSWGGIMEEDTLWKVFTFLETVQK
tara:strand:+ start:910 stop:1269 length:360 start_codon:yes stop_codon:yes gene_type:complete